MGDFRWNASMSRAVIVFPEVGGRPPKAVLCILKAVKAYILPGQYIFLSQSSYLFWEDLFGRNGSPGDNLKVVKCPKFKFLRYKLLKLIYIQHLKQYYEKKLKFFCEAFSINGLGIFFMKVKFSHIYLHFYAFLWSYLDSTEKNDIRWSFSLSSEHYFLLKLGKMNFGLASYGKNMANRILNIWRTICPNKLIFGISYLLVHLYNIFAKKRNWRYLVYISQKNG